MSYFYLAWCVSFVALYLVFERVAAVRFRQYEERFAPQPGRETFGPPISLAKALRWFASFPSTWVLLAATLVAWGLKFYIGDWRWPQIPMTLGTICVVWPLAEWFVHRFFEHAKPRRIFGTTVELMTCRTHQVHHRNPWDPRTGLSPPFVLFLFCAGVPLIWCLLFPLRGAVLGIAITLTLILNYEWLHFLIHTSYRPRSWLYRRLWINHRLHHFKNEHYWFGLTMLGGDNLFRTGPHGRQVPHSQTVMTPGADPEMDRWLQVDSTPENNSSLAPRDAVST